VARLHSWQVSVAQAVEIQRQLANRVLTGGQLATPRFIAGVDISAADAQGVATGAAVVLEYPSLKLVEVGVAQGRFDFPYVPGLLSFRESPITLAACEKLTVVPDLILVDGQGIAHPRRLGLACHLGLFLDKPTIGCAKSRLCGGHDEVGAEVGNYAELKDSGEIIGAALRTKTGVNLLYVSIGHKIDLKTAIHWVMNCCRGYRLPEPARLAHLAAGGNLKPERDAVTAEAGSQGRLFK